MKNKVLAAAILAMLAAPLLADKLVLDDDADRAPAAADAQQSTLPARASIPEKPGASDAVSYAKLKTLSDELAELKSKQSGLAASITAAQDEIKIIEERTPEIDALDRETATLKDRLDAVEKSDARNTQAVEKAAGDMSAFMDATNQNIDKLQGWNDIIDVLKKSISDNETEIAEVKRSINGLKIQYGDNDSPLAQVLKWPYAGFTAMLVSIIALGVAVAKK